MKNVDEKQSTKSLPKCEQAEDSAGVRKKNPEMEKASGQGWTAEDAECGFWEWERKNKIPEER
jgi:hypothetical protein